MIIVGIDVASRKHDYFMVKPDTGETFSKSSVTIGNSEKGYKKLHEDITAFCGATGDYDVRIGLESTGIAQSKSYIFSHKVGHTVNHNRSYRAKFRITECL